MSISTYHIVGDVHGAKAELDALLTELGYRQSDPDGDPFHWVAPPGCMLVSVGDLVDRGPDSLGCLRTLKRMVETGQARMVIGNHEHRYAEMLRAQLGIAPSRKGLVPSRLVSWLQLLGLADEEKRELLAFIEGLPAYLELDGGRLVVVHARWAPEFRRLPAADQLRACAFGRPPGDRRTPAGEGPPAEAPVPPGARRGIVRLSRDAVIDPRAFWARDLRTRATVVFGHQVVRAGAVVHLGNTVAVESGAHDGHALSAWSYPDDTATQVLGAKPWKSHLRPYLESKLPVGRILFPTSLSDVYDTLREERLAAAEEYLLWLELFLEGAGVTALDPLPVAIAQAHRCVYERAAMAA